MRITTDLETPDRLTLEVHVPDVPLGAVLLLYGVGHRGDTDPNPMLAERLCTSGFLVVSLRLDLDHGLLNALDEAITALRWLQTSDFVFDRACLALLGVGLGGTIAIEVGLKEGLPVAAWSALIDFKGFMDSSATLGDTDHLRNYDDVSWETIIAAGDQVPFLRGVVLSLVVNNLSLLASISPLGRVTKKSGPMLLFNSVAEMIPAKGVSLIRERMEECDVQCATHLLEGARHGSEYLLSALPATIRFFQKAWSSERFDVLDAADGTLHRYSSETGTNRALGLHYGSPDFRV